MIFKNNILELAENYDFFILDIWGVIHDGSTVYPFVREHLQSLRKAGKKICFLSNAPRRAFKAAKMLASFDITAELYDFIITSGEAVYLFLKKNQDNNFLEFKENYYYIGPMKDIDILDGLKYNRVEDAAHADFVISTGFDNDFSVLEEKSSQLKNAREHNLPMICVNPDLIVIKRSGHEMLCAGVLADQYKKMGGRVIYFGKPYKLAYEQVLKSFSLYNNNCEVNVDKIIAVGDSIETDILGANSNNIDSVLIGGGILSNKLKIKYGQLPDRDKMVEICRQYKIDPKFVIAEL